MVDLTLGCPEYIFIETLLKRMSENRRQNKYAFLYYPPLSQKYEVTEFVILARECLKLCSP